MQTQNLAISEQKGYFCSKKDKTMRLILFLLTIGLLLLRCGKAANDEGTFFLQGAWMLTHVKYPTGTEYDYLIEETGTYCFLYDRDSMLYECKITKTPSGLIIKPTTMCEVTLFDKGGGNWLYMENGNPHPLIVDDTSISIQRNGILYSFKRADDIYLEWGAEMRNIIADEMQGEDATDVVSYVLSARERRLASYINWLVMGIVLVVVIAVTNYIVSRRRRQQLQLQLRQIQEVQEHRPQAVRMAVATVEKDFFASDAYAALQKRLAEGRRLKEEDWADVEQQLKTVYPGFASQLRSLYAMSELEYQVCLLIKLRIAPKDIAAVLARDVSTISTVRSRLFQKVFGKKGGAKEWDDFILSIGT